MRGKGCEQCRYTGYKGRLAIYEMLPFTEAIKDMTLQRVNAGIIKKEAMKRGMRTLRDAGWRRVYSGDTTAEEVLRLTADTDPIHQGDA